MKALKKAMSNYWAVSLFCVIVGGALIYDPAFFTRMMGLFVGGLIALYGAVSLLRYFIRHKTDPENASGLVSGVILVTAGAFIMVRPDFIPKVIAVIIGIYMVISGLVNIQESMYAKGMGDTNWPGAFIPALVTALLGITLLINPLLLADATLRVMGVCLLIAGLMNIGGSISVGRSVFRRSKEAEKRAKNNYDKTEFIDIQ